MKMKNIIKKDDLSLFSVDSYKNTISKVNNNICFKITVGEFTDLFIRI